MGRIVAVTNQKGGVGKTTTTVNLAASLASLGQRILLVDIDPQGNASSGYGIGRQPMETSVYAALTGEVHDVEGMLALCRSTELPTLQVLPAGADLYAAEVELAAAEDRFFRLRAALALIVDRFDTIFIDCPPSLGVLTLNALAAANSVLIPMQAEYYALEGLSQLAQTIEHVRAGANPELCVEGVLLTMFDRRNNLARQVAEDVRGHYGDRVYRTVIPRNVRLSEAPSHGKPIILYDIQSVGCQSYLRLAKEFIKATQAQAAA